MRFPARTTRSVGKLVARVVVIGEAMLELVRKGENWQLGYGGDTLNTAIHLARAGHDVAYLTALGSDPLSSDLKYRWAAEGLDISLVLDHPTRSTGLYAITNDVAGERSFTYWRETSAAREMFELDAMAAAKARTKCAELLGFSLISLAILPDAGRRHLLNLASLVRANGGKVPSAPGHPSQFRQHSARSRCPGHAVRRRNNRPLPPDGHILAAGARHVEKPFTRPA